MREDKSTVTPMDSSSHFASCSSDRLSQCGPAVWSHTASCMDEAGGALHGGDRSHRQRRAGVLARVAKLEAAAWAS